MKKHNVVALVGTLALLANLLVPGLAFGQAQTGTATLTCSATAPTFTVEPEAAFDFQADGNTVADIVSSNVAVSVYNNPAAVLGTGAGTDYIEVQDVRDPSESGCNEGLTVVLHATDPDTDTLYFDGGTGDFYIPLNTTYFVTSSDTCPAGSTEAGDVCFDDTALCGNTDGNPATDCDATDGTALFDYTGTAFTTIGTFTGVANSTLGTAANTPADRTILSFADNNELYGKAGVGIAYATTLRAGQPYGTYTMNLEYVLTGM
jgi:hypothetical protein